MKSVVLAVLFLFVLVDFSDGKGWIACKSDKDPFPSEYLIRNYDTRGLNLNYGFIVGDSQDILKLESEGFQTKIICKACQDQTFIIMEIHNQKQHLALKESSVINQSIVADFMEDNLVLIRLNVTTETLTTEIESRVLPLRSILPSPSFEESKISSLVNTPIQFTPIISETIEKVSQESLYNFDKHLSEEYFTRNSNSPEVREAQKWISSKLSEFGLQVTTQSFNSYFSDNICGELRGVENPKDYVIVGSHYDSRSTGQFDPSQRAPGADDNGSGSSAMLEIARVLSSSNVTFSNSIRICFWSGEEQGLIGSDAYAEKAKEENLSILAYLNADMLGYKLPNKAITLGMKDRSVTKWLLDLSIEITQTYLPELPVRKTSSCCSDYLSFFDQGYPSIGFFENEGSASNYPFYHQSTDTIEKVNFQQVAMETKAIFASLMTLAIPL